MKSYLKFEYFDRWKIIWKIWLQIAAILFGPQCVMHNWMKNLLVAIEYLTSLQINKPIHVIY